MHVPRPASHAHVADEGGLGLDSGLPGTRLTALEHPTCRMEQGNAAASGGDAAQPGPARIEWLPAVTCDTGQAVHVAPGNNDAAHARPPLSRAGGACGRTAKLAAAPTKSETSKPLAEPRRHAPSAHIARQNTRPR